MNNYDKYYLLVEDIFENKEFRQIEEIRHHGNYCNRMVHAKRVSYLSYNISKFLNLDYKATARAGLLHDFFLSNPTYPLKIRFRNIFIHPRIAKENALKYYDLTKKEINIIEAHMFPIYYVLPIYPESIIVSLADKIVATYEFVGSFKCSTKNILKLAIVFLITKL